MTSISPASILHVTTTVRSVDVIHCGYHRLFDVCKVVLRHTSNKSLRTHHSISSDLSLRHEITPSNTFCWRSLTTVCTLHARSSVSTPNNRRRKRLFAQPEPSFILRYERTSSRQPNIKHSGKIFTLKKGCNNNSCLSLEELNRSHILLGTPCKTHLGATSPLESPCDHSRSLPLTVIAETMYKNRDSPGVSHTPTAHHSLSRLPGS